MLTVYVTGGTLVAGGEEQQKIATVLDFKRAEAVFAKAKPAAAPKGETVTK